MTNTALKGQMDRANSADDSIADPNATVVLTGEQWCEGACPSNRSNGQPANACEEAIRALAHSKWVAARCPTGDGIEFWLEAEREVISEKSSRDTARAETV